MNPAYFLLVDDLEENLLSLEALLRREDLILLKARSGDEALELLLQHDVALALIDVQMPGLNGFELAELMRGSERSRRVPIIFVTAGTADNQRRFRGYEAGAVDFIQKPIESDILRSKADVFFELYRQRQQIAAQRDELLAHTEALKEADRRKDDFLATLAHELRNPLAPLRHGLDVLRSNPSVKNGAEIKDVMDRQLVHLVRLIDDLLDVSRVRQGKIELRKTRIDARDAVRAAVEATQPFIDAGRHTLTVQMPPDPLFIDADFTRLSQVVANLLNNAAKYTPQGGQIDLRVNTDSDELVISVADNGIGIPHEMQSSIFQLFTQVGNKSSLSQGGLGIGLALVQQLVEIHGGRVTAESEGVGRGSVFKVRLKLAAGSLVSAITESTPASHGGFGISKKVLVIDDNVDVAQTVGWLLEEIGHEHLIIHDGRLAIAAATEFEPDAILLDIGLPVMDGYAVCRALRENARFKDILIIAQTGWGQSRDKALASEAGFDHHLTKPVTLDDLERVLADTQPD